MTELTDYKVRKGVPIWALILIVGAAAVITGVITALIANVAENKGEASVTYIQYDVLTSTSYDPVEWSQNFPRQYKGWAATETFKPTAHAPALVPHEASDVDPRTETASSKLVEDPRLLTLWAGNIFSKDYRHLRGHWYAYTDQNYTLRVLEAPGKGQPAACLNCHASLPGIVDALGNGDREAGWSAMNLLTYAEGKEYADDRPLGCIDCHNPENMELTITRPALVNAMAAMKAEQGIANYDVNRDASVNEMRALICAQCHVEYYFAPDPDPDIFLRVVTFPWKYGLDIDDSWDYYQEINFADFTNTKTGARQLKAQHPEYEIWSTSIHAANGVTCADCHMPYQRVGSQKTSNHEIMSPMANISGTCGACHTASDQVLEDRVRTAQNRFTESRDRAFDAIVQLFTSLETARAEGSTVPEADIAAAQAWAARAGYYLDYITSENSIGFHSPDYFQRVANQALDYARNGQLALLGIEIVVTPQSQDNTDEIADSGLR